MAFLLDTHTLLWAIQDSKQLSGFARKHISDLSTPCYYSIVSLWEITIKHSLGAIDLKMHLNSCFDIIVQTGFIELPVTRQHLKELSELPNHHKDPFDRLLISQAISERLVIITKDGKIPMYNVPTLW